MKRSFRRERFCRAFHAIDREKCLKLDREIAFECDIHQDAEKAKMWGEKGPDDRR
ncbi:MAG: hypothetical protein ABDK94_03860 [Atribacterota bacterium]